MPVQKGKSSLLAKYGDKLRKAHEAHKGDETEYSSFGELPPGIENGIAQLVLCEFKPFKTGKQTGEYYFMAQGVAISPDEHDGRKVAGMRTQIGPEPLCDTPGKSRETLDEHLAWIYNEMRKLGANTDDMSPEDMEAVAAALQEAKPYFRFRTWQGKPTEQYPNPRVNHQWNGAVDYHQEEGDSGVEDSTPAAKPSSNGTSKPPRKPGSKPAPAPEPEYGPPDELNEVPEAGEGEQDLDALAAEAVDSEAAQQQLTDLAVANGVSEDQIAAAASWEEVVELIRAASEEAEEANEEEWKPAVEQVYRYRPLDAKTKKPVKNSVEAEVIKVDEAKRTVDLRNLDNPKVQYKAVKWEALESAS